MGNRISRLILATLAALSGAVPGLAAECDAGRADLRWPGGTATFDVEVADDANERSLGLMYRSALADNAGMLFVYDHAQPVAFWMKNTLIPLDMLFIDATGRVVRLHPMAVPHDETPIPSGSAVQFVLELPGGTGARLGLGPGAEMRHPAVAQAAAVWPCD